MGSVRESDCHGEAEKTDYDWTNWTKWTNAGDEMQLERGGETQVREIQHWKEGRANEGDGGQVWREQSARWRREEGKLKGHS